MLNFFVIMMDNIDVYWKAIYRLEMRCDSFTGYWF